MQVHIDRGGQRFGPYSVEQVNAHLADGSLLATDLGWTDGMTDWLPLPQVPGVTAAEAAPPPPTAEEPPSPAVESALPSPEPSAGHVVAKPVGNKNLLIGIGAGVGVLALAAVGYFVVYPKLSDDGGNLDPNAFDEVENPALGFGNPNVGQGMGPPGRPGGNPQGGFGGQGGFGQGRPQGGGSQGGFGGQGRPKGKGGGLDPMRYDQNKDGKISRTEVPKQMSRFFDMVDKNKDGFLDSTEMQSFGAGFGGFGGKGRPKGGQQGGGQQGGKGRPQGGGQQRPPKGGGQQQPPQGGPQGRPQPRPIQ